MIFSPSTKYWEYRFLDVEKVLISYPGFIILTQKVDINPCVKAFKRAFTRSNTNDSYMYLLVFI